MEAVERLDNQRLSKKFKDILQSLSIVKARSAGQRLILDIGPYHEVWEG